MLGLLHTDLTTVTGLLAPSPTTPSSPQNSPVLFLLLPASINNHHEKVFFTTINLRPVRFS